MEIVKRKFKEPLFVGNEKEVDTLYDVIEVLRGIGFQLKDHELREEFFNKLYDKQGWEDKADRDVLYSVLINHSNTAFEDLADIITDIYNVLNEE